MGETQGAAPALDKQAAAALLPAVSANANKYSRGTVLLAGGSQAYPGALLLAAQAASRSGAGYVRAALPASAAQVARMHLCSIPVDACAERDGVFAPQAAEEVLERGAKSSVFVIGPGMGAAHAFFWELCAKLGKPAVFDADALNAIAHDPERFAVRRGCVNVLTPHEGEAARLLGRKVADRHADACELAERFDAVVVLKGPQTLVVDRSGACKMCSNAGPELAKAGTGDVLAGMIGAFVSQGVNPLEAAWLAVYLHGNAGRRAAACNSVYSVTPEDVIDEIGPAIVEVLEGDGLNTKVKQ